MGRIALITGGTGGLGSRIALKLLEKNYSLALNYRSNEIQAKKLINELQGDVTAVKADIGNLKEVRQMADELYNSMGVPDVIINCAGIARDALLPRVKTEDWDQVIRVNLTGAFNLIQVFSHLMKLRGEGGNFVNISSYSGIKGKKGQAAYSASKAALIGLSKSAALELAEYGIQVNVVLPGYMPTQMGRNAPGAMEGAIGDSLLKRLSDPDEAASFICQLIELRGVTGQVFALESRIL